MIRYGCVGDPQNPAIVLIHGFLGTPFDWTSVAARIDDDLFCVVLTLPGHAGAPISRDADNGFPEVCSDIKTILDRLEINTAVFAGYSLGGRVALEFSKTHAHRVRHLIAISAHFGLDNSSERHDRLTADQELATQLLSLPFPQFLDNWYNNPLFASIHDHPQLEPYLSEKIRLHKPVDIAAALTRFSLGHQTPFDWATSSFPIDYLAGKNDEKYRVYGFTLPDIERIQLSVVPESGHAVLFQQPDAISELILSRMPF